MPFHPSSRNRIDQLLAFLREALEPSVGVYNPPARARTGKGRELSIVWQTLMSQLAEVRDLAILRSVLRRPRAILARESSESSEIEPCSMVMLQAAIAREILDIYFPRHDDPKNPDAVWEVYQAALLLTLQSPLFLDVTKDEQEAAVRRIAARYVWEEHTASSKLSADAQEGLQELQHAFDIDRSVAKWVAFTVGIDRALTRWHEPRPIRLDRPSEYSDGKVSELPLLGLDEVGLVEERYHRDEERHKPVPGLRVFLQDFRRRVIADARSWLAEYHQNPAECLERATLATTDRDSPNRPERSHLARILNSTEALKREQEHLRLLFTVANDRLPDREQRRAAEELVTQQFRRPVHPKRWPEVAERFESRREAAEAARKAAVDFLLEGVWQAGQEREWEYYSELLRRLQGYLNREVTEWLAGPGWRRQSQGYRKKDDQEKKLPREELLPDVAVRQVSRDAANLEAEAPVYRDSVREERAQQKERFDGWREELAVFLSGASEQDRALWTVMRRVVKETDKVNVSEGYRQFESQYPHLPASSSEDTFRRRWRELRERFRDHLSAA